MIFAADMDRNSLASMTKTKNAHFYERKNVPVVLKCFFIMTNLLTYSLENNTKEAYIQLFQLLQNSLTKTLRLDKPNPMVLHEIDVNHNY